MSLDKTPLTKLYEASSSSQARHAAGRVPVKVGYSIEGDDHAFTFECHSPDPEDLRGAFAYIVRCFDTDFLEQIVSESDVPEYARSEVQRLLDYRRLKESIENDNNKENPNP